MISLHQSTTKHQMIHRQKETTIEPGHDTVICWLPRDDAFRAHPFPYATAHQNHSDLDRFDLLVLIDVSGWWIHQRRANGFKWPMFAQH